MGDLIKFPNKRLENSERTIQDVFDSMNEEQKQVVYFLVGSAIEDEKSKFMAKLTEVLNKGSVYTIRQIREMFKEK